MCIYTLSMQGMKALASLHICAGLHEPSLLKNLINAKSHELAYTTSVYPGLQINVRN